MLAVGTAWGEWSAGDFSRPEARQQIANASRNQAPPEEVPRGLERLSSVWTAPFPGYAPSFVRNKFVGYLLSGMFGVGLIIMLIVLAEWATQAAPEKGLRTSSGGFIERSIASLVRVLEHSLESEKVARADGLLQRLDPRVKIIGSAALIVATVASRRIAVIAFLFAFAVLLTIVSQVPIRALALRVWASVLGFTGLIALPAAFTTPGPVIYQIPLLHWGVTATGLRSAAFLIARAETAATVAVLLVLCTPWAYVLKGLRVLRFPVVVIVILGMTYRYIFLLLETAGEMFESRRSRQVGRLNGPERRRLAAASAGVLLGRTFHLGNDVYLAMQSRGFDGEVHLLSDFSMKLRDYAGLVAFLGVSAAALYFGR